jgi:RHS repeat-associated protein
VNGILVGSGSIFVSSGTTLQSTGTINVANAIAGLTGSVTVTLKLFGGSNGNNATFRLDDFTLNGYTQEVQVYAESYRFGFNGMEKDDEVKGGGNSYDFGARMYDARVGRWLSVDALAEKQPEQSSYKAFLNNPLVFVDPNGKTEYETIVVYDPNGNLLFKAHRKISDNLMSGGDLDDEDGVRISGGYDYRHYTEIRMQNDGQIKVTAYQRTEILTQNGLKDKEYIFAFKNKGEIYNTNISSYIPLIPEGDGGTQNGGWKLTVHGGGSSPTKQRALYQVEEIEITNFLTAWGAMKVGSYGSKPVDALKNIAEIWTLFAPKIEKKDSKKEERNVKVFERQFNSDGSFSLIEYKEKMTKENADKFHGKYNKTGDTTTYDKY